MRSIVLVVGILASAVVGTAAADPALRSTCTREGLSREVELRWAAGVEGICDVIERHTDDGTEERTLHAENGRGFCRARFEDRLRALRDSGWRCSDVDPHGAPVPAPGRRAGGSVEADAVFATRYRERCEAAFESRHATPSALCACAVRTMNEAGFTERDYMLLGAPYGDGERELPVHAAGLLYGLGAIAVDALEGCGS